MKLPKSFSGDKDGDKNLDKILKSEDSEGTNRLVYIEMVDSEMYDTVNEAYKEFLADRERHNTVISHHPGEPGAYLFMKEDDRKVFTDILDKKNVEYSVHEPPEELLKELSLGDWKYIQMDEELFTKKEFPEPKVEEEQEDGGPDCNEEQKLADAPKLKMPAKYTKNGPTDEDEEEQEMVEAGPNLKMPAKYTKRLPGNCEEEDQEVPDYPDDAKKPKS